MIETAHSRFPVIDGDKDDVVGILLAKDLLRYYAGEEFDVRDMLRPAVFIPESKRLNVLLKEFRANRNHMAIVVDEYGGVAGLVTIEDVLEQIVGDIEDEYDFDETEDNIVLAAAAACTASRRRPRSPTSTTPSAPSSATRSTTPSAAWCCSASAACPSAARRSPSTISPSRCCAPTAAACTRCWSERKAASEA